MAAAGISASLRLGSFNMEIREAGIAKVLTCLRDPDLSPDILFTQEDLKPGESVVNKGVEGMLKAHGEQLKFRGGEGFPIEGYTRIAESSAESADWIDRTEGLLSGMTVANKIYMRKDLDAKVLMTGRVDILTLDHLIDLDTHVPPRASPYAVVQYKGTVLCFISVHLSGGRFDDELVKRILSEEPQVEARVAAATTLKAQQLGDVAAKVHDAVHGRAPVRFSRNAMGSMLKLSQTLAEERKRQPAEPLPPVDVVVLGGDCNSYGKEVTSLHTDANPQFGYATGVLFGPYAENAGKVDAFLRYQTVPDEVAHSGWQLRRELATNAATARSSIYGGIVDHFFVHTDRERVRFGSTRAKAAVVERGLRLEAEGKYAREASDHNPVSMVLEWGLAGAPHDAVSPIRHEDPARRRTSGDTAQKYEVPRPSTDAWEERRPSADGSPRAMVDPPRDDPAHGAPDGGEPAGGKASGKREERRGCCAIA